MSPGRRRRRCVLTRLMVFLPSGLRHNGRVHGQGILQRVDSDRRARGRVDVDVLGLQRQVIAFEHVNSEIERPFAFGTGFDRTTGHVSRSFCTWISVKNAI